MFQFLSAGSRVLSLVEQPCVRNQWTQHCRATYSFRIIILAIFNWCCLEFLNISWLKVGWIWFFLRPISPLLTKARGAHTCAATPHPHESTAISCSF
jgi:hypothetical protein